MASRPLRPREVGRNAARVSPLIATVFAGAVLLIALAGLARIDARTQRLPDLVTYPLVLMGLVWAFGTQTDLYPHLLGAALGYGVFWAVEVAYRLVRKRDGLGRGDAKLLAAGGAWCGALALPVIVLIASVAALIRVWPRRADPMLRLAFGPYLALAIAAVWLVQRAL